MPLNPYQRGQLWWWLADETRPREPQIECIMGNEEDQVCDPEQEFLERTCLHGWMRVEGALVSRSDSFRYVQLPPVHARTAFSAKFSL